MSAMTPETARKAMEIMASRLEHLLSDFDHGPGLESLAELSICWGPREIALGRAALAFYEAWLAAETTPS